MASDRELFGYGLVFGVFGALPAVVSGNILLGREAGEPRFRPAVAVVGFMLVVIVLGFGDDRIDEFAADHPRSFHGILLFPYAVLVAGSLVPTLRPVTGVLHSTLLGVGPGMVGAGTVLLGRWGLTDTPPDRGR
ncbi:MAG: hypothetical protein ABEI75_02210 [Halobaculum sp.]